MLERLGEMIIIAGVILIAIGVLFLFGDRIPLLGKLPGDLIIRSGNVTTYIPIVSSIVLSNLLAEVPGVFRK